MVARHVTPHGFFLSISPRIHSTGCIEDNAIDLLEKINYWLFHCMNFEGMVFLVFSNNGLFSKNAEQVSKNISSVSIKWNLTQ